jgi:DNA-binding PadR family transcriptional regulator
LTSEQYDQENQFLSGQSESRSKKSNKLTDLLDILILSQLWAKPMGGYQLRKDLFKEFGILLSYGTLYPHLKNLEKSKFIFEDPTLGKLGRKKLYKLTPLGTSVLKFNALAVVKIANSLRPILDSR